MVVFLLVLTHKRPTTFSEETRPSGFHPVSIAPLRPEAGKKREAVGSVGRPVHRRPEERHAAGGVVEGGALSKLLEEGDVRRLPKGRTTCWSAFGLGWR